MILYQKQEGTKIWMEIITVIWSIIARLFVVATYQFALDVSTSRTLPAWR